MEHHLKYNHRNSGLRSSSSSVVSRALQSFMELAEKEDDDDDERFRMMDDDYSIESEWNKLRRASELLQRELNCVDGGGIDFDDSFCNNNSNYNPSGNEDDEQSSLGWDEIWHNLRRQQSFGSQPQQQQQTPTTTTTTTRELTPKKRTLAPTTSTTPRTMARKGSFSSTSSARTFHTEEEIRKLQHDLMAGLQEVSQIHAQLVNTRHQDDDDTATPDRHGSSRRRQRQRERAAEANLVDESTSTTTGASTTASLMQGFEQVKEIYAQLMEHSASTQELQDSISSSSFVQEAAPTLSSSVSSSSAATTAATIATSAAMATTKRGRSMHDASGYPATESHLNSKNNHNDNYNASMANNSNSCIKRTIQIEGMRELLLLDGKDTEGEQERTLWQRAALFLFGFEDWRITDPVDRKTAFVLATVITMALLPKA